MSRFDSKPERIIIYWDKKDYRNSLAFIRFYAKLPLFVYGRNYSFVELQLKLLTLEQRLAIANLLLVYGLINQPITRPDIPNELNFHCSAKNSRNCVPFSENLIEDSTPNSIARVAFL